MDFEEFLLRALILGVPIALGYAIGWLVSPKGRELRAIAGYVIAIIAVGCALLMDHDGGLILASTLAPIGFFVAAIFAMRSNKTSDEDTDSSSRVTTFGSSSWATMKDLMEYKLVGRGGALLHKS
ncbi:hypothetical protein N1037_12400 [Phaeobacter sp. G2]|nr:hypothetical protein N1037_12400 [Phaeobacter sp. G2]